MTRKAVILAAGMGRRMGKLGHVIPKCLLSIYNKPILFHQIDGLLNIGITDISIVIGHKSKEIRNKVKKSRYYIILSLS